MLAAALTWRSGGIELAVALHAANNLTLTLIAPLAPQTLEQGEVSPVTFVFSTVPDLICVPLLWWWIGRREGLRPLEPLRGTGQVQRPVLVHGAGLDAMARARSLPTR